MKPYRNAVTFTAAPNHTRLLTSWLLLAASLVLSQHQLSASQIFTIGIDTAPLVGAAAGPFSLDFQFTDGSGLGDQNNTITLSGFNFGSGAPTGTANLTGGAVGSLSSQIVMTDSAFFNEAFQAFTPGAALTFSLSFTTNLDSPTPDELSIGILDNTLSEIPTHGPGDAFLVLDLNASQPVPRTFASDITRSPFGGGGPINIPAPLVSAAAPEPGTILFAGAALLFLGLVRRRSNKQAAPRCQKHSAHLALIALLVLCAAKGQAQTITASLFIGGITDCVAVNPATNRIYSANESAGIVTVLDGGTYRTLATVNVGGDEGARSLVGNLLINLIIAINPATNKIYVANVDLSIVTVIDGVTNAATTVATGPAPSSMVINPVTNKIYVAGQNNVTVIDGLTNAATTVAANAFSTQVVQSILGIAVNPRTNKVYVAGYSPAGSGPHGPQGQILILDGATSATQILALPVLPFAVAVNQVTNQIYTANIIANTVSVIDAATGTVTSVPAGQQPAALAVNSATNKIYAANTADGTVTIIDGATNHTTTVAVGTTPVGFAVSAFTNQIFVANAQSNNISIIDGAADTITGSIATPALSLSINPVSNRLFAINEAAVVVIDLNTLPTHVIAVPRGAISIAIQPVTNKIYVGSGTNLVGVYDGATEALLTTVQVANGTNTGPIVVALNPVANTIYAANTNGNTVAVIDGNTDTLQATITVGANPTVIAVDPQRNKIYVANQGSATLTVIDGNTYSTVSVPVGQSPTSVAVNIATGTVYVANQASQNVTVVDGATLNTTTVAGVFAASQVFVDAVDNKVFATGSSLSVTAIDATTLQTTQILATTSTAVRSAAFNPVTNQLFVVDNLGRLNAIDGATNAVTLGTVASGENTLVLGIDGVTNRVYSLDLASSGGSSTEFDPGTLTPRVLMAGGTILGFAFPSSIAVNPVTQRVYLASFAQLTVIDEVQANSSLLLTTVTPIPGNLTNSGAPTFTFSTASLLQPSPPPATNVYYQLDTWEGPWTPATANGSGVFTGRGPSLLAGAHVIYAYATDGEEAPSVDGGGGLSVPAYGPMIGNITAYAFSALPAPARDVSGQVTVTRGGFLLERATGLFVQVLTATNSGSSAVPALVSVVIDNLSANASLSAPSGTTALLSPLGSPYINLNLGQSTVLNPGQSVQVILQFKDPTKAGISYTTRVLAGTGGR